MVFAKDDLAVIVTGFTKKYELGLGLQKNFQTRTWANAQPDGRPAEHKWRPLFNAAKFG